MGTSGQAFSCSNHLILMFTEYYRLFFLKQWQELCRSIKTKEIMYKRLANGMPKRVPKGLTNTRGAAEYKHDTLHGSSLPSIVAKPRAAPTSHVSPPTQATPYEPEASGRNRSSLPSSSNLQRAAPTSSHDHMPCLRRMPTPENPSQRRRWGLAACHRCRATSPTSSVDFSQQDPP